MLKNKNIVSPTQIRENLQYIETSPNEHLILITTDKNLKIINYHTIFIGYFNINIVDPKTIIFQTIKDNAKGIILVHNHPSKNTTPSKHDKYLTQYIKKICSLLAIKLIDHIIISKNNYLSFKEENLL